MKHKEEEHWTAEKVEKYLLLAQQLDVLSLNYTVATLDDDTIELGEVIQYDGPSPDDVVIANERSDTLQDVMRQILRPNEYKVLCMRYGIDGNGGMTLQEIADKFDITRERVRQIETKALRKLRHNKRIKQLEEH